VCTVRYIFNGLVKQPLFYCHVIFLFFLLQKMVNKFWQIDNNFRKNLKRDLNNHSISSSLFEILPCLRSWEGHGVSVVGSKQRIMSSTLRLKPGRLKSLRRRFIHLVWYKSEKCFMRIYIYYCLYICISL